MHKFPNFHPWIGQQFAASCFGIRVLVVGESHYWDRAPENIQYPDLWNCTTSLTQEVVEDWGRNRHGQGTAQFFTHVSNVLRQRYDGGQYEDANGEMWNHVAFYNYVQSYVQRPQGQNNPNRPTDEQWEEGKGPFNAVLQILRPDAVLMLGGPNDGTSGWITHNHGHANFQGLYNPYEHNGITFLGIYHPSAYGYWDLNRAITSFRTLLEDATTMSKSLFSVGYGIQRREKKIREIEQEDHTHAVILAAVHFEWVIKRTILKLGHSPTKTLRKQLEDVYRVIPNDINPNRNYKKIWKDEIKDKYKNSALGTVLGRLEQIQNEAFKTRGKIIHGNGTVDKKKAKKAIDLFLEASQKLCDFAQKQDIDLDSRLKTRRVPRSP